MTLCRENIELASYTSFGTSAIADRMVEWDSTQDLIDYLRAEGQEHLKGTWTILGHGCNTLFTQPYHGTIIHSTAKGIEIIDQSQEQVVIRVAAGHLWDEVVEWSCQRGLWGAENLSAIPSSVGASAVQNIGAYGVEAKDIIHAVEYVDTSSLSIVRIAPEECRFGYRESIFKHKLAGRAIITAVEYRLSLRPAPKLDYGTLRSEVESAGEITPEGIRKAVVAIRKSKLPDPLIIGNAGSFFKNPILPRQKVEALKELYPAMPVYEVAGRSEELKIATGWMIDSLGWKGQSLGRAGVHAKQALVLVNLGGATGGEIITLAERICLQVKEKFGVEITPEVNIL